MMHTTMRTVAVLLALSMVLVACGQKDGVRQVGLRGDGQRGGEAADGEGEFLDEEDLDGLAEDIDDGGGADIDAAAGAEDDAGGGETGAGGQASSGGDDAAGGGGDGGGDGGGGGQPAATDEGRGGGGDGGGRQQAASGGDSTGVTDSVIRIGVHAPETGAAPLPTESFRKGAVQYWRHVGKVAGRTVEVTTVDDQYNPSRATQVCRQLIEQRKVFLLVGGGGADQIAACARTAAGAGVPYLSAGVDEGALRKLPNYFALSPSYVQQADLLVAYIRKHASPSNKRVAIIRDQTPSFNNVVKRMQQRLQQAGYEPLVRQTQGGPSDGQWLRQNNIETAFPIMAPSDFLQIARAPGGQIDNWVGVGITMGLNQVANAGCQGNPAFDGSMFFSPFPGLNKVGATDPTYNQAGGGDDIQWALWGLNKTLHEVFKKMGDNLTRGNFVRTLESQRIASGIFPEQRHSSSNHFGTNQVHVLQADCSRNQFVTPDGGLFKTGF